MISLNIRVYYSGHYTKFQISKQKMYPTKTHYGPLTQIMVWFDFWGKLWLNFWTESISDDYIYRTVLTSTVLYNCIEPKYNWPSDGFRSHFAQFKFGLAESHQLKRFGLTKETFRIKSVSKISLYMSLLYKKTIRCALTEKPKENAILLKFKFLRISKQ